MDETLIEELRSLEKIILDGFDNTEIDLSKVRRYAVDIFKQGINFYFRHYHATPKKAFGFGFGISRQKGNWFPKVFRKPFGPHIEVRIGSSYDKPETRHDFETYSNTGITKGESYNIKNHLKKHSFPDTFISDLRKLVL